MAIRVTLDFKNSLKEIKALKNKLTGRQWATGVSRGINRSLMEGRTEARTAVKDEYNIPQKNLQGINISRSTPKTLTGHIFASTKPIPMDAFAPKFETPTASITVSKKGQQKVRDRKRKKSNPGRGVSIEVHKGDRQVVPFAFMIRGARPRVFARGEYRKGSYGFHRRHKRVNKNGTDRPIKPLVSVTVHTAVINKKSMAKIKDRVVRAYPKHVAHELRRIVATLSKSGA